MTACAAILMLALCASMPVLAVKPGKQGAQSSATLGITLVIHPTIRAQHIQSALRGAAPNTRSAVDYLCLEMKDTPAFSVYVLSKSTEGTQVATVARWSGADARGLHAETGSSNCPVSLALDLSKLKNHGKEPVTLIVSPE